MSYYQQRNRSRISVGQHGNVLTMLIAINLAVFAILAFIKVVYYFTYGDDGVAAFNKDIFQWVTLPADMGKFISRPWTLLTRTRSTWHCSGCA